MFHHFPLFYFLINYRREIGVTEWRFRTSKSWVSFKPTISHFNWVLYTFKWFYKNHVSLLFLIIFIFFIFLRKKFLKLIISKSIFIFLTLDQSFLLLLLYKFLGYRNLHFPNFDFLSGNMMNSLTKWKLIINLFFLHICVRSLSFCIIFYFILDLSLLRFNLFKHNFKYFVTFSIIRKPFFIFLFIFFIESFSFFN